MKGFLRQVAILLAAAVIPAATSVWFQRKRGNWKEFGNPSISIAEVSQLKNPVLWVDACSGDQYASNHIPGAMRLIEDDWNDLLPSVLAAWQPNSVVVVYCDSQKCHASKDVAHRLREEVALDHVFILTGGWEAWKEMKK